MITCMKLAHTTPLGQLYEADCLDFLRSIASDTVHTFFADPPFNLGKAYGKKGSDNVSERQYLAWSNAWLDEAVRVLVPGGALFVYNLPKWLISYGAHLNSKAALSFKHWIAIDKAHSLPIPNRLSQATTGCFTTSKAQGRVCSIGMPYGFRLVSAVTVAGTLRTMGVTKST